MRILITSGRPRSRIRGTIVHDNDLSLQGTGFQIRSDAIERFRQATFLVKSGNNDGKIQWVQIYPLWCRTDFCDRSTASDGEII